ncbi:hypothetical protein BJY01DRAFT_212805 [Aspergillus pseudoustus]|uniref:Profilin n=1 Tax=Aspergillus pseudoustus TaxID=1810923 RepID=A0ABR4K4B1_9EURO
MASWQAYLDPVLASGNLQAGAIIQCDNSQIVAQSPGFQMAAADVQGLTNSLGYYGSSSSFYATRPSINGVVFTPSDYQPGEGFSYRNGSTVVSVYKSNTMAVLGVYSSNASGTAIFRLSGLADWLKSNGY